MIVSIFIFLMLLVLAVAFLLGCLAVLIPVAIVETIIWLLLLIVLDILLYPIKKLKQLWRKVHREVEKEKIEKESEEQTYY